MDNSKYNPGIKPYTAMAVLVDQLRVRRHQVSAFAKAGLTLLEKRGLVSVNRQGEYQPEGDFWDIAERVQLTNDGYLTDEARKLSRRHLNKSAA